MTEAAVSDSPIQGLSADEARARLAAEGYNELPSTASRSPLRIVFEVLKEPMLLLLLGAGLIYLVLGDLKEALILLAFAGLSIVITVVQEARTERVLEALRDLTSPRATVIRDGDRIVIAGREVVRGDLVVLSEGDRVPADCRLVEAQNLEADESLLTGESVPVRKALKNDGDLPPLQPGGDDLPFAFSGSMIVRGTGLAEVVATGVQSQIGRIGQRLSALDTEPPRLKLETARLVGLSAVGAALISLATVLMYGILRGGWLDALLAGIAIGMSMLPEEFPMVLAVFMAMGAWRISRAGVLTRRAASIETLGAATVLCTDKTGTLTENRMTVAEVRLASGEVHAPARAGEGAIPAAGFADLAEVAAMASTPEPFDPMEKALHAFAGDFAYAGVAPRGGQPARNYALSQDLLAMTMVWPAGDGTFIAAAKGAPEAIAGLCRLDETAMAAMRQSIAAMAEKGLRVLGVARAVVPHEDLPETQDAFDFEFLGLVGLSDPLRAHVPAAIAECRAAGIRVVMITGDYPVTARAIAEEAGLLIDGVLTGEDIARVSDEELRALARTASVFARIMPEQKLRIVQALKADGEIVAMTGDGVNDAPSLKAAHIGVAMGARGTDVAREASAIVLLNDDFGSIVAAVRLGRRIYDNIRKAMGFIVAVHVPIAGLALLPLLTGSPIIFWPIHIAFIEMIIDPVCSLVFEAEVEEHDVMKRPPRRPDASLFSWQLIGWSLLQGGVAFAVVAAIYIGSLEMGMQAEQARALTFFSLVLAIVSLILVNRSFSTSMARAILRPNAALAAVILVVALMLGVSLFWPVASSIFRFGPVPAADLALSVAVSAGLLLALELIKSLLRPYLKF
ncbi:Calcium-transporting ATPase [Hartmannibacter diazotrophicus]|uniref:Calcium-transporting ATPase n=1 Tax=Hartmannibacter diazotrophicus TaxID=1482074 RepID=A0A2C9D423_9HYPH|nr:cation-translocating P-type ATPase [Hartmannibacter diazotrophicus]SON54970.1 Calcium-transporting ATPase [Hartmannibacter diazotrophicus]